MRTVHGSTARPAHHRLDTIRPHRRTPERAFVFHAGPLSSVMVSLVHVVIDPS